MSDDVIERMADEMAEVFGIMFTNGLGITGQHPIVLKAAKAAARVLLEAQQEWLHTKISSAVSHEDAAGISLGPAGYARSIGIDLTEAASPAPEAAPAAGTGLPAGQGRE